MQAFVLTLSYRDVLPGSAPVAGNRMCPYRVRPNERGYDAIAGIHRLEAAKQLDWTMISCIVLHDIDADQWAR